MESKDNDRKEAEALMKRLQAQFGDVDLDLELLGLGDEEQVALELEDVEESATNASQTQSAAAADSSGSEAIADAEAAALMARLGAQFGDLDMSQLGLGDHLVSTSNNNLNTQGLCGDDCGRESDEESSLEEPTAEELEAWQASQFSKGQKLREQKQADKTCQGGGLHDSIQQRRMLLRETRSQQLSREQARLRLQKQHPGADSGPETDSKATATSEPSILELLGGDTSTFFGPSSVNILEELVSEEADGDPEILQASWKRLYASYEQGLGFWNLWKALKGYDGPTLIVLRCLPSAAKAVEAGSAPPSQTACLGFYTTTPWKESSDLFGGDTECPDGDKAFLFSIDEKGYNHNDQTNVRFFPVERNPGAKALGDVKRGYMYCQPTSNSSDGVSTAKTLAVTGLGVGGRPTQPRFHLTETFEDCSCLTYDSGRVTRDGDLFACFDKAKDTNTTDDGSKSCDDGHAFAKALYCFDVTELEAWGIGGKNWINHALKERERAREQHILRYQKVNKQMMWDQGAFGSSRNTRQSQ